MCFNIQLKIAIWISKITHPGFHKTRKTDLDISQLGAVAIFLVLPGEKMSKKKSQFVRYSHSPTFDRQTDNAVTKIVGCLNLEKIF